MNISYASTGAPSRSFEDSLNFFKSTAPHAKFPYSKRNWGSSLHSLCSYQGKLKPSIAHWLVFLFSDSGMRILDPLGGVGTVALEACLQGRQGITNDLSPFPACIADAKISFPSLQEVTASIDSLSRYIEVNTVTNDDFEMAEFGLNSSVKDYFHHDTLCEVLKARRYFLNLERPSHADQFAKACMLHVLHGNRPYALSRKSHPITPFSPSGVAVYKSVVLHVMKRAKLAFSQELPDLPSRGRSYHGDFRCLNDKLEAPVDLIITSPPFIGMRFDRPNWLRLWFCGWNETDFHVTSKKFLEREQSRKNFDVYNDFFASCEQVLKPGSIMIVHLGGSSQHGMVEKLRCIGESYLNLVEVVSEDVTRIEDHGIKDKGLTTSHEYLFFRKAPY